MDRVFVIFLLAAAALSVTVSAHGDDPWFPGWPWDESPPPPSDGSPAPSDGSPPPLYPSPTAPEYPPSSYYPPPPTEPPYYQQQMPAEELFEDEDGEELDAAALAYLGAPSYSSPLGAPLYDSAPSYHDIVWMSTESLVENPDTWPAPYAPTTTVQEAFGSDAEKVYGSVSLLDGLSSKGDDGYSQLLKEGIKALLNALDTHFKMAEDEVKGCFTMHKALASESDAAQQAQVFAEANADYAANHN